MYYNEEVTQSPFRKLRHQDCKSLCHNYKAVHLTFLETCTPHYHSKIGLKYPVSRFLIGQNLLILHDHQCPRKYSQVLNLYKVFHASVYIPSPKLSLKSKILPTAQ